MQPDSHVSAGLRSFDAHGSTRRVARPSRRAISGGALNLTVLLVGWGVVASCQSSRNEITDGVPAAATANQAAPAHEDAQRSTSPASTKPYLPGVGDTMTALQLHHAKLWFAGEASNWRLVDYELTAIEESLKAVLEMHPTIDGNTQPAARSIAMFTAAPRMALRGAIAGKDTAGFHEGYDALTAGCNTCHQTYGKEFLRVVRPTKPPVTNQDFAPH